MDVLLIPDLAESLQKSYKVGTQASHFTQEKTEAQTIMITVTIVRKMDQVMGKVDAGGSLRKIFQKSRQARDDDGSLDQEYENEQKKQ